MIPVSQNGFSANDVNKTAIWTISGTTRQVRLRADDCGYLLTHFASWFDAHIEDIESGILDDWGYAERPIRGSHSELSNHASGTAIDLNATKHPLGVRGTFTARQSREIRHQLDTYGGCIRWGGDYVNRADEMHFEINKPYASVRAVALMLRAKALGKKVRNRVLRRVDLSNVRGQARRRGTKSTVGVKKIQRALNAKVDANLTVDGRFGTETRRAYQLWQKQLGYEGRDANGVPGLVSLRKLGAGRFRVTD